MKYHSVDPHGDLIFRVITPSSVISEVTSLPSFFLCLCLFPSLSL
jgi:hypothetical protein